MREGDGYVVLESRGDIMRELDLTEQDMADAHAYQQARISAYRLGEFRSELGMTQAEVAVAMGVSQRRVSQIERGDLGATQLDTIRAYIAALGGEVEISQLASWDVTAARTSASTRTATVPAMSVTATESVAR